MNLTEAQSFSSNLSLLFIDRVEYKYISIIPKKPKIEFMFLIRVNFDFICHLRKTASPNEKNLYFS